MAKGKGTIYVNLIRDGSCSRHWGMSYKLGRNNFDTYTIKCGCDAPCEHRVKERGSFK